MLNELTKGFSGKGYNGLMAAAVSLRDLVDELQMLPNEATAYLNKEKGTIITVTPDDVAVVDMEGESEEGLEKVIELPIAWLESKGIPYIDDMNRREPGG